jgi:hypothetical protein
VLIVARDTQCHHAFEFDPPARARALHAIDPSAQQAKSATPCLEAGNPLRTECARLPHTATGLARTLLGRAQAARQLQIGRNRDLQRMPLLEQRLFEAAAIGAKHMREGTAIAIPRIGADVESQTAPGQELPDETGSRLCPGLRGVLCVGLFRGVHSDQADVATILECHGIAVDHVIETSLRERFLRLAGRLSERLRGSDEYDEHQQDGGCGPGARCDR